MRLSLVLRNSKVDTFYRSVLLSKFFIKGWGDKSLLRDIFNFRKILSNREKCQTLINKNQPIYIDKCVEKTADYNLYEGHFKSPLVDYLPVPDACKIARFQLIEPSKEKLNKINIDPKLRPAVVHLAGTGDHFYWRRRNFMGKPLLDYGVTSIIMENPYYGSRKPSGQTGSCLLNVQDLFLMGGCLVLENLVLFNWLEKNNYGPLGVTGVSLGGHMASLVGCSWPKPISIIPCLSWTTASCVFTQGVLSGAIPWSVLEEQYKHFGEETIAELSKLIHSPERSDLFHAGRQFAKSYPLKEKEIEQTIDSSLLLDSESYAMKLNKLNEIEDNQSSSPSSQIPLQNGQTEVADAKKKSEQDSFRNFVNTVSFNVYDSLNKTLMSSSKNVKKEEENNGKRMALAFMVGVMDECTHLKNFDRPVDPQLSIIVTAEHDGYVPKSNLIALNQLWQGSHLRKIDAGHVTAIIFHYHRFQQAIIDSLDLNARKYYNGKLLEKSFLDREEKLMEQSSN